MEDIKEVKKALEEMTMAEINQEYGQVCAKVGEKSYQKELLDQEIRQGHQKMSQIHAQAQKLQKTQKESA